MAEANRYETYMLQLVNRARADPLAEAARYGIDLNQGLAPGTLNGTARQALASNDLLVDAARAHSSWMLDFDQFSHTGVGGSSPGARMTVAGYSFTGSWTWGENISWTGTIGTLGDLAAYVEQQHEGLFRSPGHRVNILKGDFRELGIGQVTGAYTASANTYNASMITQAFAATGTSWFLTGVVYDDADGDKFYDAGEGRGGVTVTASGSQGSFTTTSWSSGGYQMPLLDGTYSVTYSGGGLAGSYATTVTMAGANRQVNAEAAQFGQANRAPSVSANSAVVIAGQVLGPADLFGAGDPGGDTLSYNVWDATADATSGHWEIDGVAQPTNQVIGVAAADLGRLRFVAGTTGDTLDVRVSDGKHTTDWAGFTVTVNRPPVVTASDLPASTGLTILPANLFSASDPDGDTLYYNVWDATADATSGHWGIDGVAQPTNQVIGVAAADLGRLRFVAGSIGDTLYVRASDGRQTTDWARFAVTLPPVAPIAALGADATIDEAAQRVSMNISLDRAPTAPVSLRWNVGDGTATVADHDLPAGQGGGLLTFQPGGPLTQTVSVAINDEAHKQEGSESFVLTLSDPTGLSIGRGTASVTINDHYLPPPAVPLAMTNTTTGISGTPALAAYAGPVDYLGSEFVYLGSDSINLSAAAANVFLRSGSGNDALVVTAGQNVLDGGTGSNFLTGGSGADTFFLDTRNAPAALWGTVVGLGKGDAVTLWGVTPSAYSIGWFEDQGAATYTGLTMHATAPGKFNVSLTLAGLTDADRIGGRLSVLFGSDPGSSSDYMYIFANS